MKFDALPDLIDNFSLFGDDWEERYAYLISLGTKLPPMDDSLKTDQTEVKGCVSKVWLFSQKSSDGRFHFQADSNGDITKGLVYIVLCAYDGKMAKEIGEVDIEGVFRELGLEQNLTPSRRNGFFAMVEKIRGLAAQD